MEGRTGAASVTATGDVLADLLSAVSFTKDPYPAHALLRSVPGLYWSSDWGAWVASRYADVAEMLRRDGLDFSAVGQTSAALAHLDVGERASVAPIESLFSAGLLWSDPPDHDRIRSVVNKALNPRDLERMRPRAAAIVGAAVAALPFDGPFDVVEWLASPIPVAVLAELLGIPASHVRTVRKWADTLADFMGSPHPSIEQARSAQAVVLEARTYVDDLVQRGSGSGEDGVIQRLAALRVAGADIDDDEFHATVIVLLVGGHRTTAAGIASSILALARRPDLVTALHADDALIPTAVEEFLRYESPHQRTVRIALRDTELGGTRVRSGEVVVLLNGSANRDQFPRPDDILLDRHPNRHLAFSSGIHFCIGAPLARIEIAETLRAFIRRYPRFELAEEPRWLGNHTLRTPTSLWVMPRPASG